MYYWISTFYKQVTKEIFYGWVDDCFFNGSGLQSRNC
jgi:hypothetical protein